MLSGRNGISMAIHLASCPLRERKMAAVSRAGRLIIHRVSPARVSLQHGFPGPWIRERFFLLNETKRSSHFVQPATKIFS
jgi:hypothetical protein